MHGDLREFVARIDAALAIALGEEDSVSVRARGTDDAVQDQLFIIEGDLDVDPAIDVQSRRRTRVQLDENPLRADIADGCRPLPPCEVQARLKPAARLHRYAKRSTLLLLSCHAAAAALPGEALRQRIQRFELRLQDGRTLVDLRGEHSFRRGQAEIHTLRLGRFGEDREIRDQDSRKIINVA